VTHEAQAFSGFAVSGASAVAAFVEWSMPYVQWGAAVVAILSGIFAIAVSIKKLRSK